MPAQKTERGGGCHFAPASSYLPLTLLQSILARANDSCGPSVAHKRIDQATVILRHIQKLHAEYGTAISQVSNGRSAGRRMASAGQRETKTQNAANWKTVGGLNQGTSLAQVPESSSA